jgi:hypothetical protein
MTTRSREIENKRAELQAQFKEIQSKGPKRIPQRQKAR